MKIKHLLLIFLLTYSFITFGQNYRQDRGLLLGANISYQYPTGDMGKILKNGIGANISAKYLINHVIGIGFESGYHRFKSNMNLSNENTSQEYKCNQIPVLLEATFYIPTWNRSTLPYLGIQFGGYLTQVKVSQTRTDSQEPSLSKKISSFSPGGGLHGGVLFQLASDRWWLDIRLRANYIPKIEDKYEFDEYDTNRSIGFDKMLTIGAQVGLLYKF